MEHTVNLLILKTYAQDRYREYSPVIGKVMFACDHIAYIYELL